MSVSAGLVVERRESTVTIRFSDPASRNSLRRDGMIRLATSLAEASSDPEVRAVVLAGDATAFSSGADLRERIVDREGRVDTASIEAAGDAVSTIVRMAKPVCAVVRGPAVGVAAAVAIAADLVVAGRSATFAFPQTRLGLHPDGGASVLLTASVGRARALRLTMTGETVGATQALAWGMVTHVFDDEDVESASGDMVRALATGPTVAFAATKAAINSSVDSQLADAVHRERDVQASLVRTHDFVEAVRARRDRRPPVFCGA